VNKGFLGSRRVLDIGCTVAKVIGQSGKKPDWHDKIEKQHLGGLGHD
jgi:hypothetical protein